MQINTLQLKQKRKKRKAIGRGGKKGTYSGKGMKGQESRSGAKINPLFEGGRSTLIDHMKKKRGFKSIMGKRVTIKLAEIEKRFKDEDKVNPESLIKVGLTDKIKAARGIKILEGKGIKIKLEVDKNILLSKSVEEAIKKAGGKTAS